MSENFYQQAEKIIGYKFADKALLVCALTHKSYANEHGGECNGRLEYLGDSILNFLVAEYLYRTNPSEEGVLTDLRKEIVSEAPLADAVRKMGLLTCYRLGKGAQMNMAQFGEKPTSDIFEAVLGAVYLDGGMIAAYDLVERCLLQSAMTTNGRIAKKTLNM